MTCPNRPDDLDLLIAGEPTAPGVQAHLDGCDTCAAELALAHRISAALASRREATAPPAIIAAALAQAREPLATRAPSSAPRAADRPARASAPRGTVRRSSRLWRVGGIALAAVLLAALSWTALRSEPPPQEAVIAENQAPAAPAPVADDSLESRAPLAPEAEPAPDVQAEPKADAIPQQPTPRRAVPRAPRRRAAPRTAPQPLAPEAAPDTAPDPLIAENEPTPTPQDIERAEAELQLAFALIADAQRQAGRAVRSETGALSSTLDQTLPF